MNSVALLLTLIAAVWLSSANSLNKRTPLAKSKTFDLQNKTNFVVYWGSTDNEGKLSEYCTNNTYDVIILAFADAFNEDGVPQMSLDYCDGQDCSALGPQIQSCQNEGKTIMLSVGGADGSYKLTSEAYAKKVATHLWNMFLNGTGEKRPFGNGVVLDGVDFDVEQGAKQADGLWVVLINELRTLTKADPSKHYFLSGAPQCVFPDEWSVPCACSSKHNFRCTVYSSRFGPGPQTAVSDADLDFISIQFYNNYCGIKAFFGI
jgi:chitinase